MKMEYAGAAQARMNSLGGSISNFKDAVYRLQESLGKNLLPTLAELVRGATSVVKVSSGH